VNEDDFVIFDDLEFDPDRVVGGDPVNRRTPRLAEAERCSRQLRVDSS
jgi:hypothetical protein